MGSHTYPTYKSLKENKPFRRWHETIIDDLLIFPRDTLANRSQRLGYTPDYLGIIMNTDMFKAAYEARKQQFRENMDNALIDKASEVAHKGLEIMLETMESKRSQLPFAALAETVDKTLSRLGYGVQKPAGSPVQVNVSGNAQVAVLPTVSEEQLREARKALRAAEQARALEAPATPKNDNVIDGVLLPPESGES